jgi:hypothetical protein
MLLPSCIRSNPLLMSGSGMMARALFGEMDHGFAAEKEHRSVPECGSTSPERQLDPALARELQRLCDEGLRTGFIVALPRM